MSYTPTEWQTGDIVTSEKLNKAEQGIADAQLADLVLHARNYYPEDAPDDSDPVFEVDMSPNDFLEFIEANPEATIIMVLYHEMFGSMLMVYNGGYAFETNRFTLLNNTLEVYQFHVTCEEDETEVNYAWCFNSRYGYTDFTLEET